MPLWLPQLSFSRIQKIGLSATALATMFASGAIAVPSPTSTLSVSPTDRDPGSNLVAQTAEPPTNPQPQIPSDTRFACQYQDGDYTVVYYPESQPNQAYPWATPSLMGGGWTPERRCAEISRRLEFYRPDGLLEMQTSVENGYDIICVTTQQNPTCRIVLTVPQGQNPIATRDRVFENLVVADSGQSTNAVNTFTGNQENTLINQIGQVFNLDLPRLGGLSSGSQSPAGIDLRPFLDRADGGTGTRLRGGAPAQSTPRLNPNQFR